LSRIGGHILLLGEVNTDASPYIEPEPPARTNRFMTLLQNFPMQTTDWSIVAGHHAWEASIRHNASGLAFYIIADLPDTKAASLADRFEFTRRFFNSAIAFSALAALRDRETALSRLFDLAEERVAIASAKREPANVSQQTSEAAPSEPPAAVPSEKEFPEDFNSWLREPEPAKVPAWAVINSKQEIKRPDPALLPKFDLYEMYQGVVMGDRRDFFEAPDRRIQKLIGEIVDFEGPIHLQNLYKLVAGFWQIQRLDNHVQSVFTRQLAEMLRKKRVFLKDACLYPTEDYRLKPRDRSAIVDFILAEEIPLDEIQAAIFAVLEKIAPMDPADLLESVSWCFGLPPRFKEFDARFDKAVALMSDLKKIAWFRTAVMLHPDIDPRRKSVGL
jgi:hypothetical protein